MSGIDIAYAAIIVTGPQYAIAAGLWPVGRVSVLKVLLLILIDAAIHAINASIYAANSVVYGGWLCFDSAP
eukprot:791615-Rhodomonas_salina.1